mmetsp:Transcript_25276/g.63626  ORF Transcript_25276/g.63626 Transcript_25276/m.63626 type:complete len:287 (-) Transcript_25276:1894-2754(-)
MPSFFRPRSSATLFHGRRHRRQFRCGFFFALRSQQRLRLRLLHSPQRLCLPLLRSSLPQPAPRRVAEIASALGFGSRATRTLRRPCARRHRSGPHDLRRLLSRLVVMEDGAHVACLRPVPVGQEPRHVVLKQKGRAHPVVARRDLVPRAAREGRQGPVVHRVRVRAVHPDEVARPPYHAQVEHGPREEHPAVPRGELPPIRVPSAYPPSSCPYPGALLPRAVEVDGLQRAVRGAVRVDHHDVLTALAEDVRAVRRRVPFARDQAVAPVRVERPHDVQAASRRRGDE